MSRRDIDRMLGDQLRRLDGSPDLTRSIMGRLGYMQVSPEVARRRRMQRWLGRAAMVAVATAVGVIGVTMFKASPEMRSPLEATMPAAIHSDLQNQQHRINSVLQILRELPPRLEIDAVDFDEADRLYFDEDVDHSAVAPVRWA